jgi:ERCC4-type nuclease
METQKIFKSSKKIVIISDYREKKVNEILEKLGVKINQMNLEIGDFVPSQRVCVERKTH